MEKNEIEMTLIDSKELPIRPFLNKWAEEIYKNRPMLKYRSSKFRKLNKRKQKKILARRSLNLILDNLKPIEIQLTTSSDGLK